MADIYIVAGSGTYFTPSPTLRLMSTLNKTVSRACNIFRNEFSAYSSHKRGYNRANSEQFQVPYPTWEELPGKYKQAAFADTVQFYVSTSEVKKSANNMLLLPNKDRAAVQSLFPIPVSISCVASAPKTHGHFAKVLVQVKAHNVPLADMFRLAKEFKAGNGEISRGDTKIWFVDWDNTVNFPGAVAPTPRSERHSFSLGSTKFVPKNNDKYVGLHCITWTKAGPEREYHDRYVSEDYENEGETIGQTVSPVEWKLYDKFVFHLETTSVQASSGNNLTNLLYSTADNIYNATRDPEIQECGFGRGEIRFSAVSLLPDSWESLEKYFRVFYDATVAKYCHTESFAETCQWFLPQDEMVQLALVEPTNRVGQYDVCLVRWANLHTNKFHVESATLDSQEEVQHFLAATRLPAELVVYARESSDSEYTRTCYIPNDRACNLPNVAYLDSPRKSRCKWASRTLDEVGLSYRTFPFTVRNKRTPAEDLAPMVLAAEPVVEAPEETTKADQAKKISLWAQEVKAVRKELLEQLQAGKGNDKKGARKFSESPASFFISEAKKGTYGPVVTDAATGRTFALPTHLKAIGLELAGMGSLRQFPVLLIRGEVTGKYQGNPVYANAKILVGNSEEACDAHVELHKFSVLFWNTDDFSRYENVRIR